MSAHGHEEDTPQVHGLIAEFDDPDTLLTATTKAHEAGYRAMDAYAPYPVHGLAEAMGVRKTYVSLVTLIGGFTGALTGLGMQYFASVWHYPYSIGGKPNFSWPAFMPITFELGILFAAFSALGSMLIFNGLPQPYHPVFNAKRFERASSDGFFLCIETTDAQYDTEQTKTFLEGLGPVEVSEVME